MAGFAKLVSVFRNLYLQTPIWINGNNSCLVVFPRAMNRTTFNYADWVGLPSANVSSLEPRELIGPLAILTLAALCSLVRYHEAWRFARLVHKLGLSKRALAVRAAPENQAAEPEPQATASNAILFTAVPEPAPITAPKDKLNFDIIAEYKRVLSFSLIIMIRSSTLHVLLLILSNNLYYE